MEQPTKALLKDELGALMTLCCALIEQKASGFALLNQFDIDRVAEGVLRVHHQKDGSILLRVERVAEVLTAAQAKRLG